MTRLFRNGKSLSERKLTYGMAGTIQLGNVIQHYELA
jgi:hypothetical protein